MSLQEGPFRDSGSFEFDSEQVPSSERFDIVRSLLSQVFPGYELVSGTRGFRASLCAWQVGEVTFGRARANAIRARFGATHHQQHRSPSRRDAEGTLWIFQRGRVKLRQGAVDGVQEAGSAWFMDADTPGDGATEGTDVLAINIPSKALRRAVGHNQRFEPRVFAGGDTLISLLSGYLESATVLAECGDSKLRNAVGTHLTDLVALALGPTKDAAEQVEKSGLKSVRLDAVLRAISANYANPMFTIADVAAELKISVRYVQDILYETGIGFSDRVLELRLQEAAQLLARANITNRKVSDIAFSCGFNNLSYFHRAFRRRFGMTPAGARST